MSKQDPQNTVSVSGGVHVGSVIGAGKVDSHARVRTGAVGAEPADEPVTVADLREMIAAARGDIVAAAATEEERVELAYELRRILEALEEEAPRPGPVRDRWSSVQGILGALSASGAIAAITDAVAALFGSD